MDFLRGAANNLLFLLANLGIFYAMYWAFKEDIRSEKEKKPGHHKD